MPTVCMVVHFDFPKRSHDVWSPRVLCLLPVCCLSRSLCPRSYENEESIFKCWQLKYLDDIWKQQINNWIASYLSSKVELFSIFFHSWSDFYTQYPSRQACVLLLKSMVLHLFSKKWFIVQKVLFLLIDSVDFGQDACIGSLSTAWWWLAARQLLGMVSQMSGAHTHTHTHTHPHTHTESQKTDWDRMDRSASSFDN